MCRTPEIVDNGVTAVCVNCDRNAHVCPCCVELRCDSDIHWSLIGSIPLACDVCQPGGIDTWFGPAEDEPGMISIGWVPSGQPKPWEKS